MDATPLTAAATAVEHVNNVWQIVYIAVVGCVALLALWLLKVSKDSKELVAKSAELEKERTALRKADRDKQMSDSENRVSSAMSDLENRMNTAMSELSKRTDLATTQYLGLGKSFDRHVDEYQRNNNKADETIQKIDNRLRRIEDNLIERKDFVALQDKVHAIDVNIIAIKTILDERAKHGAI